MKMRQKRFWALLAAGMLIFSSAAYAAGAEETPAAQRPAQAGQAAASERPVPSAAADALPGETDGMEPAETEPPAAVTAAAQTRRFQSTFDYPVAPDQNHITDEEFFGAWDAENQLWFRPSYFNYDAYEGLAETEYAVKQGDYEAAKAALQNYYIERERTLGRNKETTTSTADILSANLLMKNFTWNARSGISPLGLLTAGAEPAYTSVDITDRVSGKIGATEIGFVIVATEKDGDTLAFHSKENTNSPYLDIKVNGTSLRLYPAGDTYISANRNESNNYGKLTELLAEESGIGEEQPVNNNTKRIYMKFDISQLRDGDTVTAATLNLYGNTVNGTPEKEAVVFSSDEVNWEEDELTYSSATAQVIYSYDQEETMPWVQPADAGYRYEEELFRFDTWFNTLVYLYNMTGDEKYAYTAVRYLMDYIRAQGSNPSHKKTLDVAVRGQFLPGLVLQLVESESMTPESFTAILKFMWRMANAAQDYSTSGNWGTSETQGLYTIAANFYEFRDFGRWENRTRERYDTLSEDLLLSDTCTTEIALGYAGYAIATLIGSKSAADLMGFEPPYNEVTKERIRDMAHYLYYASLPGVRDHQQGDGNSYKLYLRGYLRGVGEWLEDDELMYGATGGKQGNPPSITSSVYPEGRKAIMRNGWDEKKSFFLQTNADGAVGNHGHQDDLSVIVWAHGQYLLVDPLYGSYSGSSATEWLESAFGHNTVVVNGKNQTTKRSGSMDRWETNEAYDYLLESSPNTTDAEFSREIVYVRPGFWIVNDILKPRKSVAGLENKYVQSWHMLPEAKLTLDADSKISRTNFDGANISVIPVGAETLSRAELADGLYSEGQGSMINAKYVEYEKRQTGTTTFNTILLPENIDQDYQVVALPLETGLAAGDASAFEFYLTENSTGVTEGYTFYSLHNANFKGKRSVGLCTTDARMMLVQEADGKVKSAFLQDVTELKTDSVLVSSRAPVRDLAVEWSEGTLRLSASGLKEEDLTGITVSTQGKDISTAYLNGVKVTFGVEDGMAVFGKEGPVPTPAPTATKRPAGGGTHGSGGGGGSYTPAPSAGPTSAPPAPPDDPAPSGMPETMRQELEDSWAKEEVSALYEKGILKGVSDTSLGLEQSVTRAEFAALLLRALGIGEQPYTGIFADVTGQEWYAGILEAAYRNGIFTGDGKRAEPERSVTREEMCKLIAAAAGDSLPPGTAAYTDAEQISGWALEAVGKASAAGLVQGLPDGSFAPRETAKRDQAAAVICRLLKLLEE